MSLAFIGGTGFSNLPLPLHKQHIVDTDYDKNPVTIQEYKLNNLSVLLLLRHQYAQHHSISPHLINYRANIAALDQINCQQIVAFNAVGSTREDYAVGSWVIPNQLIDYTWGREHSFSSVDNNFHIAFAEPFDQQLSATCYQTLKDLQYTVNNHAVYACTQGPRLETAAEVERIKRDGADIIGMTAMPEAALAREKSIAYSSICMVLNLASGIGDIEVMESFARTQAEQLSTQAQKIIFSLAKKLLQS